MMLKEVKEYIINNSSDKVANFNNRIIKTGLPMYGIKTPVLRSLAKEISKSDYKKFLDECDNSSYEITLLEGFVIGQAKMSLEDRFYYMDRFILKIDNWAVHDGFVSSLKFTKKNLDEMYNYVLKYVSSNKEYESRFVSVMLMSYYINDEYISKDFEIISKLNIDDYYAKMGVAWFLATAAAKYSDMVYEFLKKEEDSELIKMTIRKIRDSYLIDQEFKDEVLKLKK